MVGIDQPFSREAQVPTRYSEEWHSHTWEYPSHLEGFLSVLGANQDDHHGAEMRVSIFMMTPVSRRMPAKLRLALIRARLLDPRQPTR